MKLQKKCSMFIPSAFEQRIDGELKGNFSELLTVKITRNMAKSINNPLVFKLRHLEMKRL